MSRISSLKKSRRPSLPTREAGGFFAGLIAISLVAASCGGGEDTADPTAAPTTTSAAPSASAITRPEGTPSSTVVATSTASASSTTAASPTTAASATVAASPTPTATTAAAAPTATAVTAPPTATSVPPTATTKPPPAPVSIALTDGPATFAFVPSNITVAVGTTVTWVWGGEQLHDVTGPGFNSGIQKAGTFSHTFTTAGTFNYTCIVHASSRPPMNGRIVVQ